MGADLDAIWADIMDGRKRHQVDFSNQGGNGTPSTESPSPGRVFVWRIVVVIEIRRLMCGSLLIIIDDYEDVDVDIHIYCV